MLTGREAAFGLGGQRYASPSVAAATPTKTIWFLLPLLMTISSISRLPVLDQGELLKYVIAACEFLSVGLMCSRVQDKRRVVLFTIFGLLFIILKFAFGASTALLEFGQPLLPSFQEARFGIMLAFLPIIYRFYRSMDRRDLVRFCIYMVVFIALLDVFVFAFLAPDQALVLGERTYQRYVCSTLFPLSAACILISRSDTHPREMLTALLVTGVLFLHALLITTSRIETLLTAAVLVYGMSQWLRFLPIVLFSVIITLTIGVALFSGDSFEFSGEVAGRDYGYALAVAATAFPFGFGFVTDNILRNALAVSEQYFSSDYGMLLYILRYGLPGALLALGLISYWVAFVVRSYHRTGIMFLALAFLAYILFIPILDYSSFAGGAVLSTMAILGRRAHTAVPARS
ncbi:putative membrane protein [Blastomonas sp. RAC04]|nr:putative membrane protein [Blastomonas sp. RAC04]